MLWASVSWLEFLFFFASGHTLPYTWYERHFSPLTLQKPPLPLAPLEIISHSVYWLLYFYFQCLSIELFEQPFILSWKMFCFCSYVQVGSQVILSPAPVTWWAKPGIQSVHPVPYVYMNFFTKDPSCLFPTLSSPLLLSQ